MAGHPVRNFRQRRAEARSGIMRCGCRQAPWQAPRTKQASFTSTAFRALKLVMIHRKDERREKITSIFAISPTPKGQEH